MEQTEYATVAEARQALEQLSDADLMRLERIARYRVLAHPLLNPRELLNEAVVRVLRGTRRWPKSVALVRFLSNVLRSLAAEAWRQEGDSPERPESRLLTGETQHETSYIAKSRAELPNPEEATLERERQHELSLFVAQMLKIFEEDRLARGVLEALLRGKTAEEIRNQHGLTAAEYGTVRRRIRRRVDRRYAKGALPCR